MGTRVGEGVWVYSACCSVGFPSGLFPSTSLLFYSKYKLQWQRCHLKG